MTIAFILFAVLAWGLYKKVDTFDAMMSGAKDGLMMLLRIIPALVGLMVCLSMLRASGAMDAAAELCRPVFAFFGIPPECAPLVFIRPFSGSGGLAVGAELIATYGVDSLVGRTAAVMLGSSETTFYTISVVCGAAGVSKTRYAIPAALCADMAGFVVSSWAVRFFV